MKLQKYVLIGLALISTSILAFPTASIACWATGTYKVECCFLCCETVDDCTNYLADPEGGAYNCRFNWYCVFNPQYCEEVVCDNPNAECPLINALNNDEKKIDTLRRFRDEVLSKTPVGQEYIRLYYEWSPVIVQAMEEDEEFKQEVRELIEQLLPMIEAMVK
jgi:hypothetical protein